jgi:hypothetical protein
MSKTGKTPATIAAQAAGAMDAATGGVVPGISLATTYLRDEDYGLMRPGNVYGRDHNETVRQAEEVIRQLEGAAASLLFPSGMAAVAAVFRALPSGARTGIYWGTLKWVREYCVRRAILLDEVEASDADALAQACRSSADMVWIETPSNPWLRTVDITAAAGMANKAGAVLVRWHGGDAGADARAGSGGGYLDAFGDEGIERSFGRACRRAVMPRAGLAHVAGNRGGPARCGGHSRAVRGVAADAGDADIALAGRANVLKRDGAGAVAGGARGRRGGALSGAGGP